LKRDDDLAIVVKGVCYDELLDRENQFEKVGIVAIEELNSNRFNRKKNLATLLSMLF
jgi:hypothetical protein